MPPATKKTYGSGWAQAARGEDLTVPSGETCRVIRPGAEGLLKSGVLDKADILTPMVAAMVDKAQGKSTADINTADVMPDLVKLFEDPSKINELLDMVDNVVCNVVVEPRVRPVPVVCAGCGEADETGHRAQVPQFGSHDFRPQPVAIPDRDLGTEDAPTVYPDMISVDDRMFIFQYAVGGTRDLAKFREESELAVAAVPTRKATPKQTKRTPRPRK